MAVQLLIAGISASAISYHEKIKFKKIFKKIW